LVTASQKELLRQVLLNRSKPDFVRLKRNLPLRKVSCQKKTVEIFSRRSETNFHFSLSLSNEKCDQNINNIKNGFIRKQTKREREKSFKVFSTEMYWINRECYNVCFLDHFLQLWLFGCVGCSGFGPFWKVKILLWEFWAAIFCRPRYLVNACCLGSISSTFYGQIFWMHLTKYVYNRDLEPKRLRNAAVEDQCDKATVYF